MKYKGTQVKLHPRIIIRTPVFHLEDSIEADIEDLRKYIHEASPDFYRSIEKLDTESLLNLKDKTSLSFYKYFNRAKFRPVPFGSFAAVSVVELNESRKKVTIGKNISVNSLLDWDYTDSLQDVGLQLVGVKYFKANTTVYSTGDLYRYVTIDNGVFQIVEVNSFPELSFILGLCKEKVEKEALYRKIGSRFDLSRKFIVRLIKKLTDNQLLFHDLNPNIVGRDYFSRCGFQVPEDLPKAYIISERVQVSGGYRDGSLDMMSELINHLNLNLPYLAPPHLEQFKKDFLRKFDRRSVPLSVVMDPELGVGYASLESSISTFPNHELSSIFKKEKDAPLMNAHHNPYLLYALSRASERLVQMEKFDGEMYAKLPALPNSFSVFYHSYGANPVVESIGGTSANNLLGRFTICNRKIHQLTLEIAEIEQKANPSISFFDVAYRGEKHVDNINRRSKIYEYELPLLTWSDNDKILNVDDIEVSVIENEIILFSKKTKKRIMPRIPTAYNHHRSDLGIYRFLSDIQHQGIRSDLNLSLRDYFPDLPHYPRICFKQFILSPESWRLPEEFIGKIKKNTLTTYILEISAWLKKIKIDNFFKTGHGDQTLTFDPKCDQDLMAFSHYCFRSKGSQIYISEALVDVDSAVQAEDGGKFAGQVQLSLYHEDEIIGQKKHPGIDSKKLTRQFLPGSEWLYMEIYCHPVRTNEILTSAISVFLKCNDIYLKKWFYIRYSKNGNHVRLRLHLRDPQNAQHLLNNLRKCIDDQWQKGYISDFQIKTYQREIERYMFDYERFERFFYLDSKLVLKFLRKKYSDEFLYQFALHSMVLLLNEAFTDLKHRLDYVSLAAAKFANEFNFDKPAFKLINGVYEKGKHIPYLKTPPCSISKGQLKLFKQIIDGYSETDQKYEVLADLIHLHINRIFSENARRQEAILYQYLLKDMKKSMHFSKEIKV